MEALKLYLRENKITREKFAEKVSISRNYLQNILAGRRKPSLSLALRIQKSTKNAVKMEVWA